MTADEKDIDPSKLRLENEALNDPPPEDEFEVEIDASDITAIDDQPVEETETGTPPTDKPETGAAPAVPSPDEEGPAILDLMSDVYSRSADTGGVPERRGRRAAEPETPPEPDGFLIRTFNPGDIIFKEGDPGNEAYLILNGQVKITRQYKKKSMKVNQLGKDQIFGEMAIITGEARTATAKAVEPTEVFVITEEKLNENLSHHLAIVKNLIDQLIDRMKQLMQQQTTMLGKVERAILIDKKLEVIKAQIKAYEKKKVYRELDDKLKSLIESILKL